jgi:hypothetical protein
VRAGSATRILLFLAAGLGVAANAYAGYEDDYASGLKALDQGRIAEAQSLLQRALSAQSEPVDKINIGGNVQPYLPLHFLGVAAYRLGDCAAAADYWNGAANRRMIARLNLLRQQEQQALANCKPAAATATVDAAAAAAAANAAAEAAAKKANVEAAALAAKPPDALVQALQNYLGGRYLAATRIDPATLADSRAKFHAYLVRAAARFMLASTGLGDQGLLDAARGDARAARALDARTQPDAATFPPRFRAFYEATR